MTTKSSIGALQKQLMARHYQKAADAKKEGRKVVYLTAMFPVEVVKAFEPHVAVVYPENHAVALIVNGMAERMADLAVQQKSLDTMGCSYELANTGYLLATQALKPSDIPSDLQSIPALPGPDILLACNNQCDIVAEWYQNLSLMYGNIPFKVINVGNRYDGVIERDRIEYVKRQILDVISLLEKQTGSALDRDIVLETADRSNQAMRLWKRYLDFGKEIPSPITVFDGFYHMAPIVSERGSPEAIEYYRALVDETQGRLESGAYAVIPEKHRILWDNLATWFNFGELKRYLNRRGVAVVGSTYLDVWKKQFDTSGFDALITSLAESYCVMYTNLTIQQRIDLWKGMVRDYQAEGVLFHNNKSCHTFSRLQGQIAQALKEEFGDGFKAIVFDGDMGLQERFQKHRFFTAIETFF
jgi:benzoyl-CoA reductase/2-hydroxyglutaryl-CoA dehydratase subunit BcrC/BadD/HgdB